MNKNKKQYIVVGSGISGVSCATALMKKKNVNVLMIDSGYELEQKLKKKVNYLYNLDYKKWPKKIFNNIPSEYHKGIPLKKIFGSDYIYKIPKPYKFKRNSKVGLRPSFAKGGFSNIWGAAIMPFCQNDILDWPLSFKKLEKYYKEVVKIFDVSGKEDSLSKYFPLFKKNLFNLSFNEQGNAIYNFLKKNEKSLRKNGFFFGKSRLAFNKKGYAHKDGCVYCGMCLTGCPKEIIYSSNTTLENLKKNKNFKYISGFAVTYVKENNSNVYVYASNKNSKKTTCFTGKKVFLGAGVLQTTSIIANSLKLKKYEFEIKDNSLFYLPLLFKKSFLGVQDQKNNTLSQIFFEILDKKISSKFVHAQLYLYNNLYKKELYKYLYPLKFFIPKIIERYISRLTILQVYLHSDYSSKLIFHYKSDRPYEFSIEEKKNEKTYQIIKNILSKIKKNRKYTGLYPVLLFNKILRAGQSYHCGSTLPMKKDRTKKLCTDLLGRPNNLKRIHCIDSSVLPSIPATTITLSVMANAYRIGFES